LAWSSIVRGVLLRLFLTDVQKARKVGEIPGQDAVEFSGLLARWIARAHPSL
jgi:hypothetical protein